MSSSSPAATATAATDLTMRDLYGGALRAMVPERFVDIRQVDGRLVTLQLREVPDHQEVFADTETEESVIVELLELDTDVANEQCARFHFQQIAEHNEAVRAQIVQEAQLTAADMPHLPEDALGYVLAGDQDVAKFRERSADAINTVRLFLAVLRLPRVGTDVLITVNVPVVVGAASSSRQHWGAGDLQAGLDHLRTLVGSIDVRDWGLFGSS
ncbi:hypothetical protein THASP1DRAFT_27058 [Thamnocephalis sphaerospora]|uniref:Uncharacterized protein n=1 Tax=Thamnocephalis sphaerospora TaxID=78915 RepID=A0A4P9XZF7_9FUNG|nr:hypothetical protein THASP1DRAFT_27058 [Thamnocephalis sphaerospora]|eukprot:RKP11141.1 hypothetical protein THASP1DRAFT_27058 [Thamnocephalis sphaerospora]